MNEKIYISGPISGLSRQEYTNLFSRGARMVAENGDSPVNPVRIMACPEKSCNGNAEKDNGDYLHAHECYMRYDLLAMLTCDGILMLPGWRKSKGALIEHKLALDLHFNVYECNFTNDSNDVYWRIYGNG